MQQIKQKFLLASEFYCTIVVLLIYVSYANEICLNIWTLYYTLYRLLIQFIIPCRMIALDIVWIAYWKLWCTLFSILCNNITIMCVGRHINRKDDLCICTLQYYPDFPWIAHWKLEYSPLFCLLRIYATCNVSQLWCLQWIILGYFSYFYLIRYTLSLTVLNCLKKC